MLRSTAIQQTVTMEMYFTQYILRIYPPCFSISVNRLCSVSLYVASRPWPTSGAHRVISEPRVWRQVTCDDVLDMFDFATTDFDSVQRRKFMQVGPRWCRVTSKSK